MHVFVIGYIVARYIAARPHLLDRPAGFARRDLAGWAALPLAALCLPNVRAALGVSIPEALSDPLLQGGSVALFLGALMNAGPFRLLGAGVMRFFGNLSFGIYLLHQPVIYFLLKLGFEGSALGTPLVLGITIAAAWISHRLFEMPVQSLLRAKLGPPRGVGAVSATP